MQGTENLQQNPSSVKQSIVRVSYTSQEEESGIEDWSPSKKDLYLTFKKTITQPFQPQEQIFSSITSAKPSVPSSETKTVDAQNKLTQMKQSLPDLRAAPKVVARAEQMRRKSTRKSSISQKLSEKYADYLKNLKNAVQFLTYPFQVEKYCYRMKKIQRSVISFSEDLRFLSIYRTANGAKVVLDMSQYKGFFLGIKTQRFQSYLESGYKICEENAFSLNFKNRSYDFTVRSNKIRNRLAQQLYFLWQQQRRIKDHR